jgi:predicted  nucleic acid-binding Zn-ribbon protein
MSFLDCMSCGFGAVILFFMIINAQVKEITDDDPSELMAETKRLEVEILEGRKNLVLAKNTIETLDEEKQTAEGKIAEIIALIKELREELACLRSRRKRKTRARESANSRARATAST